MAVLPAPLVSGSPKHPWPPWQALANPNLRAEMHQCTDQEFSLMFPIVFLISNHLVKPRTFDIWNILNPCSNCSTWTNDQPQNAMVSLWFHTCWAQVTLQLCSNVFGPAATHHCRRTLPDRLPKVHQSRQLLAMDRPAYLVISIQYQCIDRGLQHLRSRNDRYGTSAYTGDFEGNGWQTMKLRHVWKTNTTWHDLKKVWTCFGCQECLQVFETWQWIQNSIGPQEWSMPSDGLPGNMPYYRKASQDTQEMSLVTIAKE